MKPTPSIYSGLDLGKVKNFTAFTTCSRIPLDAPSPKRRWRYECRWIQVWDLGTRYTQIATDLRDLYAKPQLRRTPLGADNTGVGLAVLDQLRAARVQARLVPITSTSGKLTHKDETTGAWNVPKTELIHTLLVIFQAGLIKIDSRLPLTTRLQQELASYRETITKSKNVTFGAEASQQDDLVASLANAVWLGEHEGGGEMAGLGTPADDEGCAGARAPDGVYIGGRSGSGHDPNKFGG